MKVCHDCKKETSDYYAVKIAVKPNNKQLNHKYLKTVRCRDCHKINIRRETIKLIYEYNFD